MSITLSWSLISIRNDEISGNIISSIFSGRSTIEYFIAITTVALVNAAELVVRTCRTVTKQSKGICCIKCQCYSKIEYNSHFFFWQSGTLSAGTSFAGSISAILPKHSATTLRTPSSSLSQWLNSRLSIFSTLESWNSALSTDCLTITCMKKNLEIKA